MTSTIGRIAAIYARAHRKLLDLAEASVRQSARTGSNRPPVFVFSLHKSGSHLLRNVMEELGYGRHSTHGTIPDMSQARLAGPDNYIATGHRLPADNVRTACARGEARIILNIRDPRDIFLSTIDYFDWMRPDTAFDHVNFYRDAYRQAFASRRELALAILDDITLGDYPYTISSQLSVCQVLYFHPSVLCVRYEGFMECAESGNQKSTDPVLSASDPITEICRYLQMAEPENPSELIRRAIANGSRTMNVGRAARWRTELDRELLARFEAKHRVSIEALGYAVD